MSEFTDDNPEATKTVQTEPKEVKKATTSNDDGDQPEKIVIGDREFSSMEELQKSWLNAQQHISTIEKENADFRDKQVEARTVDELMKRLESKESKDELDEIIEGDEKQVQQPVDIEALINSKLTEHEVVSKQNANYKTCMDEARKALGTNFIEELKNKSIELFGNESEGVELAKKSPEAFSKLFVPKQNTTVAKPTTTQYNSSSFQSKGKPVDYFEASPKEQAAILANERKAMKEELGLI